MSENKGDCFVFTFEGKPCILVPVDLNRFRYVNVETCSVFRAEDLSASLLMNDKIKLCYLEEIDG